MGNAQVNRFRENRWVRRGLRAVATGFGAGRFPVAPGTAGTLVGLPLWYWTGGGGRALLLLARCSWFPFPPPGRGWAARGEGPRVRRDRRDRRDAPGGDRDPVGLDRPSSCCSSCSGSSTCASSVPSPGSTPKGARVRGGGRPGRGGLRGPRVPGDRMADRLTDAAASLLGAAPPPPGRPSPSPSRAPAGLLAGAVTAIPGSSVYFSGGVVAYDNAAKIALLGVPPGLISARSGQREVAVAMAEGVLALFRADVSIATTGIAGPGGGSRGKPVGTVWVAVAVSGGVRYSHRFRFPGDRGKVRRETVRASLRRDGGLLSGKGGGRHEVLHRHRSARRRAGRLVSAIARCGGSMPPSRGRRRRTCTSR